MTVRVFCVVLLAVGTASGQTDSNWPAVGGDRGCMRYSTLDQITTDNVSDLQVAWTWHTGELSRARKMIIECTPIVIDGVMYVSTGHRRVAALNAATGEVLWMFDPMSLGDHAGPLASGGVNRGVAWWSDGRPNGDRRILHGTSDGRLFSLDARTGRPDPEFGRGGYVLLRDGIEYDISRMAYGPTSAPAVAGDLVVLGFSNSEGPPPGAPGDIRAFHVRSGKEAWRFHTIPRPGEIGHETWPPDGWQQRSGANAWGGISVDETRGLVFAGTGSAAFDFYGGDRKGSNLFANTVLALDAKTGARRWHFQTLHHDLWDHDLPTYPNLITVRRAGRDVPAAAQVTKTGHVFLFHRETGEPLFDIRETPVPPSDVPGEQAWPTQPIPVRPPPFSRQQFDESDITDISPEAHAAVLKKFRTLRSGPPGTPPSLQGTICLPGFHGGATWSGASFDPQSGLLFVNSNNVPYITKLIATPDQAYPYRFDGYTRFTDDEGFPANKPPWGQLSAIDLNTGTIVWQQTLGEEPVLAARGIRNTGSENFGGTIATRGGLIFIGATRDEKFRAFDQKSGAVLWSTQLPAGGYATPCTYQVAGRQFVCIAAGGAGKLKTKPGDAFVAFALPQQEPVSQLEPGIWRASLETPGGALRFDLHLARAGDAWEASIVNRLEPVSVPEVEVDGHNIRLAFPHYDSQITATLQEGVLRGHYRKRRGAERWEELAFRATPATKPQPPADFSKYLGRWRVNFSSSDDPALGVFAVRESDGAGWGTFLTTTGDYRFLTLQSASSKAAELSVFDGAHAFLFRMSPQADGTLKGDFWSGSSWHETWTAQADPQAALPDAFRLSRALQNVDLNSLRYRDLDGNLVSLGDPKFAGKARIIQVFGSWCPNCHDAALYMAELHRRYAAQGLSIVGLAFEHTGDFDRDVRQVRRYVQRHETPYPVLLAGLSDKAEASRQFPLIDRVRSYPTTIFLREDGSVRAVYTGFSGPATGEAHQVLRRQFEAILTELLEK